MSEIAKKDVIYIDIEDDITSIIEKIKKADAKIVALVPPKRVGSLQSVVNLKLLVRAADASDHRVVLITSDKALTNLAAGISIPVAKNLQSKPEVAPIAALEVDNEDIINGEELPVGELAKTTDSTARAEAKDPGLTRAAASSAAGLETADLATETTPSAPVKPKFASGVKGKIPNFERFRKRLFLIGGGAAVVIAFFVWAIFFAPHAEVTITAKTTSVDVAQVVTLDSSLAASDPTGGKLKATVQQVKKTASTTFAATGSKDVGTKATGKLTLTNQTLNQLTVPAGTQFVAAGKQFTSDSSVTMAAPQVCGGFQVCKDSKQVAITAADIGADYNVGPQSYSTSAPVTAAASEATAGGSRQTVQVVSQDDVDKAKTQLTSQNASSVQSDLTKQFTGDVVVVGESFTAAPGQPSVTPNVGDQATEGKLNVETTYTLIGVTRTDMKAYLDLQLAPALKEQKNQRIYADGDKTLKFSQFQAGQNNTFSVKLATSGNIGPNIDTDQLAKQIEGKRYGEVQQIVSGYDGVDNVDVNFSPFWVTTVPTPDKTNIKFKVTNGSQ